MKTVGAKTLRKKRRKEHARMAAAVREGWLSAPVTVAAAPPPRMPVTTWSALSRELDRDRGER